MPEEVKRRRNNDLLAIQNAISHEDNQPLVGRTLEVLVEGPSKTSQKLGESGPVLQLVGRTRCDRIVVFSGTQRQIGRILPVTIVEASPFTLFGSLVTAHVGPEVHAIGGKSEKLGGLKDVFAISAGDGLTPRQKS